MFDINYDKMFSGFGELSELLQNGSAFPFEPRRNESSIRACVHGQGRAFYTDEGFIDSRRFIRWTDKLKKEILQFLIENRKGSVYLPTADEIPYYLFLHANALFICDSEDEEEKIIHLFRNFLGINIRTPLFYKSISDTRKKLSVLDKNKEEHLNFFKTLNKLTDYNYKDEEIANTLFKEVCINFLETLCIYDKTINKDNFTRYIPTKAEALYVIQSMANKAAEYISTETLYRTSIDTEAVLKITENLASKDSNDEVLESLKCQIANNESIITTKNQQIADLEKSVNELKKQLTASERARIHLETSMNRETATTENHAEQEATTENATSFDIAENAISKENTPSINTEMRIAFVAAENKFEWKNKVTEAFPNAFFPTKASQINASKTDAVVLMTKYVSHNMSEIFKNICISNNIPFINCNNFNIDIIKNTICDYFARNSACEQTA